MCLVMLYDPILFTVRDSGYTAVAVTCVCGCVRCKSEVILFTYIVDLTLLHV